MPWPVYSETFIRTTAEAVVTSYTVPAGHRAVVKTFSFANTKPTGAYVQGFVSGIVVVHIPNLAADGYRIDNLMAVAYAGQTIQTFAVQGGVHQTANGYLFRESSLLRARPPETDEIPYTEALPLPAAAATAANGPLALELQ